MSWWQVCPLGPTGYGDSPYQCFSAFAGNPYLIDLQDLVARRLLTRGRGGAPGPAGTGRGRFRGALPGQVAAASPGLRAAPGRRVPGARARELRRVQGGPGAVARTLRALPRPEGQLRRPRLVGVAGERAHVSGGAGLPSGAASRRGGGAPVLPVRVLLAMAPRSGRRPEARDRHHRGHPHLRRRRLGRCLGPSRALRARRRRPARRRGRRAARLFLGRRPALGQPALPMGTPRRRRLRLVEGRACAHRSTCTTSCASTISGDSSVLADPPSRDNARIGRVEAGARAWTSSAR